MKKVILLLVSILASSLLYSQEIRYVNDELVIQLRSGPTFGHRILRGLKSGRSMTVISESSDGKWTQVSVGNTEGWVPSQYLSRYPAAKDTLKKVSQELNQLKEANSRLKEELAQASLQASQSQNELQSLNKQNNNLDSELEKIKSISAKSLQLNSDNTRLLHENEALKNQLDVLSTDNQRLSDARKSDNFMNGAFAVLIGVFITLLVPRLWPKKRSEWA